jgi:FtsZ-interacting cell division protein ZipA
MSDVQLTLLFLGLFVILIMLIHNWIQLRKHNKNKNKPNKASQKTEITDENDPLFNPANPIFERERELNPELEGYASEQLIRENLPSGIFREIEAVASITTKEVQNGTKSILVDELHKIPDARLYVRNGDEIWTTGEALDEAIRFNQILIVLLLTSRKGVKNELEIKSFQSLVANIKSNVDGSLFWLANQDIAEEAIELNKFRVEVDQSLFLKVIPKSDSSFQIGALLEFFEDPKIISNKNGVHELKNSTPGADNVCQLLSLSGKKLIINPDTFLQGILFKMDIPNTKNITYSFNEMTKLIDLCKKKLNGVLVDVKSNELDVDKISMIYASLKTIEDKMIKKNIMPGSDIAKKLFS